MLEWILSSSVLILLVLAVRALGKTRLSCRVRYALWLPVLVRLLVPVQVIETPAGNLMARSELSRNVEAVRGISQVELMQGGVVEGYRQGDYMADRPVRVLENVSPERFTRLEQAIQVRDVLLPLWYTGAGVLAIVLLASNLRFLRRLKRSRAPYDALCGGMRVYVAEELASPCLVGVFRPSVYLTPESTRDELTLRHVLAHETTHRLHGDCVWSVLRLIALCLHWYNPLVWYAVIVSKRDGELACDEATLQRLGEDERIPYGETLLRMVTAKPGGRDLLSVSTAMTAGRKTLRERIETIARHPKTRWVALLLACAVLLSATVLAFSKAREEHLTAETAMDALESSVHWDDEGNVSFTIPHGYAASADWQIQIAGRSVAEDGMSKSVHEYELLPGVTAWEAGKEYTIRTDDITELFLTASLPDANGSRVTTEIDLLTGNSWTLTYLSDAEQSETEKVYSTGSPDDMWDVIALRRPEGSYSILKETRFDGALTGNREDMEKALRSWYTAQFGESAFETSPPSSDPSYRWDADLDGDGVPEQIWLDPGEFDAGGEASMWIETGTGEHVEIARIATSHAGWSTVALTERGGKTFLLTYHPTMFQGYAHYIYQLAELREGKLAVVDSAEVSFSVNPGQEENNDIEALRAFQEKANGVWSRSGVLFTTDLNVLPHLSYADSGDAVLTNPRYYIWNAQEAARGKVRYEETMYGLLDADEPIDAPALTPDEPSGGIT